jgi:hypothetical protein
MSSLSDLLAGSLVGLLLQASWLDIEIEEFDARDGSLIIVGKKTGARVRVTVEDEE